MFGILTFWGVFHPHQSASPLLGKASRCQGVMWLCLVGKWRGSSLEKQMKLLQLLPFWSQTRTRYQIDVDKTAENIKDPHSEEGNSLFQTIIFLVQPLFFGRCRSLLTQKHFWKKNESATSNLVVLPYIHICHRVDIRFSLGPFGSHVEGKPPGIPHPPATATSDRGPSQSCGDSCGADLCPAFPGTSADVSRWLVERSPIFVCVCEVDMIHWSGQIIATSHNLTPNGGLAWFSKGSPLISGRSGLVKYYSLTRLMDKWKSDIHWQELSWVVVLCVFFLCLEFGKAWFYSSGARWC